MPTRSTWNKIGDNSHYFWAIGMLVLGVMGICLSYLCQSVLGDVWFSVLVAASQSIVVAGLLTASVDPFLKKKILREASLGIFKHMVGFDHPQEIKDRLEEIVKNTTLVARNMKIDYEIKEQGQGSVLLRGTFEVTITNPTNKSQLHTQHFDIESGENPSSTVVFGKMEMEVDEKRGDKIFDEKKVELKDSSGVGVMSADGWEVKIKPDSSGHVYRFRLYYEAELPRRWYSQHHFGMPTVGVTVSAKVPDKWTVGIASQKPQVKRCTVYDKRLLMRGQHIDVRWFPPDEGGS